MGRQKNRELTITQDLVQSGGFSINLIIASPQSYSNSMYFSNKKKISFLPLNHKKLISICFLFQQAQRPKNPKI